MKKLFFFCLFFSSFLLLYGQNQSTDNDKGLIIRLQSKVKATQFFQKYTTNNRNGLKIQAQRKVSSIFNIYTIQSAYKISKS